jgi:uncharacterized protein involved in high-affinity Fe2+ transport
MQGYSNGSVRPYITVNYNVYVEACMQGYTEGSVGPFITVHDNG